jgi:large subunit ribosomal protein L15
LIYGEIESAKRGFHNKFGTVYSIVNVDELNIFNDGDVVNLAALMEKGIIRKENDGLKVLGNGEIAKKLTVEASVFSATAKEKIEAAGGKTEVI